MAFLNAIIIKEINNATGRMWRPLCEIILSRNRSLATIVKQMAVLAWYTVNNSICVKRESSWDLFSCSDERRGYVNNNIPENETCTSTSSVIHKIWNLIHMYLFQIKTSIKCWICKAVETNQKVLCRCWNSNACYLDFCKAGWKK